jgi:hypothetical protein
MPAGRLDLKPFFIATIIRWGEMKSKYFLSYEGISPRIWARSDPGFIPFAVAGFFGCETLTEADSVTNSQHFPSML